MRVLVIGSGAMGSKHISNLIYIDPLIQIILFTPNSSKDKSTLPENVAITNNITQAINSDIDFAIIASPPVTHVGYIISLLQSQIPCYIEKPIVSNQQEYNQLNNWFKQQEKVPITMMGTQLRFMPSLKKIQQLIDQNEIGKIVRAQFTAASWLPKWRPNRDYRETYSASSAAGGGVIFDLIHELDQAIWFFGEMKHIYALSGHKSNLEINSEDTAVILLESSLTNTLISINLDYVSHQYIRRYEWVGDHGTIIWDFTEKRATVYKENQLHKISIAGEVEEDFDINYCTRKALQYFMIAVRDNLDISPSIKDGLSCMALALKIHQAAN